MRKMIKAFRKARFFTREYGGAKIYWNDIRGNWQAAPVAHIPSHFLRDYSEMKNDGYPNFIFS